MAATGILWDAISATKTKLEALGLQVVTDPRNVRPFCVFLELPSVSAFTYNVGDMTIIAHILAPPPSNQDASDYLITKADQIMNSSIAVTDLRPGYITVGGQELPTYDLTIAVAVRRN